jgi:hypothetical protein
VLDEEQSGFSLSSQGEEIYLNSADGTWVVDAVRFGPQEAGVSSGRFPDGAAAFRPLDVPTAGLANRGPPRSGIIINEIMYNPLSGEAWRMCRTLQLRQKRHRLGGGAISELILFPTGSKMAVRAAVFFVQKTENQLRQPDAQYSPGLQDRLRTTASIALGRPETVMQHRSGK